MTKISYWNAWEHTSWPNLGALDSSTATCPALSLRLLDHIF